MQTPPENPLPALPTTVQPSPHRRSVARWVAFSILLGGAILLVTSIFGTLWQPLFLAAVLAGTFTGLHVRLTRKLRGRKTLAATLVTLGVVLLVLIPLVMLSVVAVQQTIQAVEFVRDTLESGGTRALLRPLPEWIRPEAAWFADFIEQRASDVVAQAATGGRAAVSFVTAALSKTSTIAFDGLMMLIAFHALLTDGRALVDWGTRTVPLGNRQIAEILLEFRDVSRSVLGSMFATAAAQAVSATIGYAIAGVPQVLFFGLLTFFASFIPSVGTALVAVPLGVILLITGNTGHAIFLFVWTTFVVGLADNLLRPLLVKGRMRLNGALVFFSLIGGVTLFGLVGLMVGPLAVTFFLTMVRLGERDFSTKSA